MKKRSYQMLLFIIVLLGLIGSLIFGQIFMISIVGYHFNSSTDLKMYAANVNTVETTLQAKRGFIIDRNGEVIAQDIESYTLYAIVDETRPSYQDKPSYVVDKENTATLLAAILKAPETYILDLLNSASYQTEFGLYGSNLSTETKENIEALNLTGLGFIKHYARSYPLNVFASSLIGYVGKNDTGVNETGKLGLESFYEAELAGKNGLKMSVVDRYGYSLLGYPETITDAIDGQTLELTLDRSIQEQLESSFLITQDTFKATEMFGGVMEVETGKILAMGQYPSFDPNKKDVTEFRNFGTQYIYEPGSTLKTFTYAAAIDTNVYNGQAFFNSVPYEVSLNSEGLPYRSNGSSLVIGTIRNAHNRSWGTIDYDTGYTYSSNVGIASLLTTSLDLEVFHQYLIRFGFNDSVKTDRLAESTGTINFEWPYDQLTVGFGQGITVNMLQMMQAYTAILNDGSMLKPYLVNSISDPNTHAMSYQAQPEILGQPIQASTALKMQALMKKVTHDPAGTGRAYAIEEVEILAKTGTAQIYVEGGYSEEEFLYSVMIGLPADDPKVMVYYAFKAPATLNAHFKTEAVQQLLTQIALVYNLQDGTAELTHSEVLKSDLSAYRLPNFINHSIDYARDYLKNYTSSIVIIGNQSSIQAQYPQSQTEVLNNQRIFLLTEKQNIVMPDFKGMSKKDVLAYFELVDIPVTIVGEGEVISQNIEPLTPIDATSLIEIGLA